MVLFNLHLSFEVRYYIGRLIPFSKLEEHNIVKVHETPYVVFRLRYGKGVKKGKKPVLLLIKDLKP